MPESIPYYDSADGRLLATLTADTVQRYLTAGTARAVRTKRGRIVRLYSLPRERAIPIKVSPALTRPTLDELNLDPARRKLWRKSANAVKGSTCGLVGGTRAVHFRDLTKGAVVS
jgi:hypothetical protein